MTAKALVTTGAWLLVGVAAMVGLWRMPHAGARVFDS